ncbi:MAG: endonuclease III [Deltaproteobacteria bacterium]|nr:endonuclease III [Deltaproteobacteria bacterium]
MKLPDKIKHILPALDRRYPSAHTALSFRNPLEMLVATILSAQCTDKKVNEVTQILFKKYRSARDFAEVPLEELEVAIHPTGFFHNKAKSIKNCCSELIKRHQGQVPRTMEELTALPGIGRKTANVVLGSAFGIPGLVVDTHVGRIVQRLGLTKEKDPVKIEFALMPLIPQERWVLFSHQLIDHGRTLCTARSPQCPVCPLRPACDYGTAQAEIGGQRTEDRDQRKG